LSTHPAFYSAQGSVGLTFSERRYFEEDARPVTIGNDVWVGDGATIMESCHVGDGAIVAASALVVKDVPAFAIVGGVPARIIRYRFSPEVIDALLEWKWWNLPIDRLRRAAPEFRKTEEWTVSIIDQLKQTLASVDAHGS
jgi:hypothetical protein